MKKKLVLLPLLLTTLTACSLPNMNGGDQNGSYGGNRPSLNPNDVAIKLLNAITIFPEVGDELDFNDYINFDPGFGHTLSEYTFASSDPSIISIDGYHAKCEKKGYTAISVSGPGINQQTELSFYVGSIAGTYVPDTRALEGKVELKITDAEARGTYNFELSIKEGGTYNKATYSPAESTGVAQKEIAPLLYMDFEGGAPSSFAPVLDYLASFGLTADLLGEFGATEEYKELTGNLYGYMMGDPDTGVTIKMLFNGTIVDFVLQFTN